MRIEHRLELVSDREKHFLNDVIYNITTRYLIKHRKTTPYNLKANGLTKCANGIVGKILNKMVSAHKMDWDLKLSSVVHAYNTLEKITTGKNPYFLVFGQMALHSIEMEVETYRVIVARTGNQIQDISTRLVANEDLEEARDEALKRTTKIQTKRKEDFGTKIPKHHEKEEGGLVLLDDNCHKELPSKLHIRWMGPYKVTKIYQNRSIQLEDLQRIWLDTRVNGSRVKKNK